MGYGTMLPDESNTSRALRVAADLRAAAAQLADEEGPTRRQRFAEILQAAEKDLAPQERPDFYRALARWFPDAPPAPEAPLAAAPARREAEPLPRTPDDMLEALRAMLATMSPKDKAAFTQKLGALVPMPAARSVVGASPGSLVLAPETLRMLGVSESSSIDVNRITPLFGLLIEVLVRLDDVAWDVWQGFGSEAKGLRRELVMKKAIAAMLTKQARLTIPQLQLQIAQLQRLTVEMLAQMNRVGGHANKHFKQISPQIIARDEEREPSRWLGGMAARCWERFSQRWEEVTSQTETAINKEVAHAVSGAVNVQRF